MKLPKFPQPAVTVQSNRCFVQVANRQLSTICQSQVIDALFLANEPLLSYERASSAYFNVHGRCKSVPEGISLMVVCVFPSQLDLDLDDKITN